MITIYFVFFFDVVKNFVFVRKKLCFRFFSFVKNYVFGSASPAVAKAVEGVQLKRFFNCFSIRKIFKLNNEESF
jgi:hypothetical protein